MSTDNNERYSSQEGYVIDPNKFRDLFKNCCNYIQGKTSEDGLWTVTKEEFENFFEVSQTCRDTLYVCRKDFEHMISQVVKVLLRNSDVTTTSSKSLWLSLI